MQLYIYSSQYKAHTLTITSDNGKEFAQHEEVAKALDTEFYFANPYQSWKRGLNEHTNGLIREYFPKKMEFKNKLNRRPRKILGYQTPPKCFSIQLQNLMQQFNQVLHLLF